jgi:hypothetical protein
MKIRVIIEIEEYGEKFKVTSAPHESITEAFAEVGCMAENHRRLIQDINCRKHTIEKSSDFTEKLDYAYRRYP